MKNFMAAMILVFSSAALAKNVYVAPVQGTNVSKKTQETVRELIKIQVQGLVDHKLVNRLEDAEFYLQSKLIEFDSFTLSINRWQGNKKVASGQWKAKNKSELEAVVAQAVPAVIKSEGNTSSIGSDPDNKSLAEKADEKRQERRLDPVPSVRQVMVGFGPAYFHKINSGSAGLGFQAAYIWNVDDHFDLGLQSDFAISTEHSDAFVLSGKIAAQYFFTNGNISPYLGAGFGYGWASIHSSTLSPIADDTAGGFAMSLQMGVKFFRTSDVNFALGAEYTNIFDKSTLGQPGALLIRVALYY